MGSETVVARVALEWENIVKEDNGALCERVRMQGCQAPRAACDGGNEDGTATSCELLLKKADEQEKDAAKLLLAEAFGLVHLGVQLSLQAQNESQCRTSQRERAEADGGATRDFRRASISLKSERSASAF